MKGESASQQPALTELGIKDTNMSREAAEALSHLLASNTTLQRVNLENNQIPPAMVSDIAKACRRNRAICKITTVPKA